MNLKSIADALAGRFAGVTATNGSLTESIATGPTASLPNDIALGPALLVYPPVAVLTVGVSSVRTDRYTFPCRMLRDPAHYPDRTDWLYAWHNALRDRVEMDINLGLSYVAWAQPVASRSELDGEEYAGRLFDVVEFMVEVYVREVVGTTAP